MGQGGRTWRPPLNRRACFYFHVILWLVLFNGKPSCGTFYFCKAKGGICYTGVINEGRNHAGTIHWVARIDVKSYKKYPNAEVFPSTKNLQSGNIAIIRLTLDIFLYCLCFMWHYNFFVSARKKLVDLSYAADLPWLWKKIWTSLSLANHSYKNPSDQHSLLLPSLEKNQSPLTYPVFTILQMFPCFFLFSSSYDKYSTVGRFLTCNTECC